MVDSTIHTDVVEDKALQYKITHVFCPLQLPDGDDHSLSNDHALSEETCAAARAYTEYISDSSKSHWKHLVHMLYNLCNTTAFEALDEGLIMSQIQSMEVGSVLTYLIRAQNAAVVIRKYTDETFVESFEVSPKAEAVMRTQGKLVCSYPGPAIAIPNEIFEDTSFVSELAHFLSSMNEDHLDAGATTRKAGLTVVEERDSAHPRYITELLTSILRGVGRPANIQRISKRIGDDVVWNHSKLPWRRSPIWLVIRVAMQTTLKRNGLTRADYKAFMLFFMTELARQAVHWEMHNDILQWVLAKISRRLMKFGASAPDWLSGCVLEACTSIRALIDQRWKHVQELDKVSPPWAPSTLNFSVATRLSLQHSKGYISHVLTNAHSAPLPFTFKPENRLRGTLQDFLSADGKFFHTAYKNAPFLALYDFEREVSQGIDGWVDGVAMADIDDACERLELLASTYSSAALQTYKDNPEDISRMLLTVIELWIALDKLVIRQIPIFAHYSPEIPTSLLERLLLRDLEDLLRFHCAFSYIRRRQHTAKKGWSVFSNRADKNSFPVRYFNSSSQLQVLKVSIEQTASKARERKLAELQKSNDEYARLKEQAEQMDHDYKPTTGKHAKKHCGRCQLMKQMNKMTISVHEWPLPADPCKASLVVFELCCPISFDMWRSTTFLILVDLCSPAPQPTQPYITLDKYSDLLHCYTKHRRSRITLASDTKPFVRSHYAETRVPSEESRVCVKNALDFHYYDAKTSTQAVNAFNKLDISSLCSYHIPCGPYRNLQKYLQDTTHTSNDVLCNQADCHKNLAIHEYIAFGHLRCGPLLQWLNILREIRANIMTFRHDEVHMLFAQAASQIGPLSDSGELSWHHELELPSFRRSLLTELEALVSAVSGNWLEGMTMTTISFLTSRILAAMVMSENGADTSRRAHQLLLRVREETFSWVLELSHKLDNTTNEDEKHGIQGRLRDMAAICRSTFDVGVDDAMVLTDPSRAIEILLSCSILIHDNTPTNIADIATMSRLLLERDHRLSWKLQQVMSSFIEKGDGGIDLAIKHVWPTYRQGSRWRKVDSTSCCAWFTSSTAANTSQRSQQVYLDVLYGTLLVEGRAVGRLPRTIQDTSLFTFIFKKRVLDVVPADVEGMEYATRGLVSGHRVYFRMAGDELILRAREESDSDIFELIPPQKLGSDLPVVLIENHVHWLNLSTRAIEVRPLEKLWQQSPGNWHIHFVPGNYYMEKGCSKLLDIRSPAWRMISSRLQPLEESHNLIITLTANNPSDTVCVELPRYGLTFIINDSGELESRNMRDMVYDDMQSIGTMFGLVNRLVLRPKNDIANDPRCVLIPEGAVSFTEHGHHVRVWVDTKGSSKRMNYQTFWIDTDMGCLTGSVSLANKLYRAYLHALTSNPYSVDPLTKKTGTEEALSILHSAASRSFIKIDARSAGLLSCIASLTTERKWYPPHLKRMQNVKWGDQATLPVASRHHGLYLSCVSVKAIHESLHVFSDQKILPVFEDFPTREQDLLERASLRAAMLYPPEFRDLASDDTSDTSYKARDVLQHAPAEGRAYRVALAVYSWSPCKSAMANVQTLLQCWRGPLAGITTGTVSMRYSRDWLAPDLPTTWLLLYDTCRQTRKEQGRFQLLFSLSAMAYSSSDLDGVAHTLLAFAVMPQFRIENPPLHRSYDLSDGHIPSAEKLQSFVQACAASFMMSPEQTREEYRQRTRRDRASAVANLISHWPRKTAPPCDFLDNSLYNIELLSPKIQKLFASCYQNWELKQHFGRVQSILDQMPPSSPDGLSYYSFIPATSPFRSPGMPAINDLFHRPVPDLPVTGVTLQVVTMPIQSSSSGSEALRQLIDTLRQKSTNFQAKYINDLRESENRMLGHSRTISVPTALKHSVDLFKMHYLECRDAYFSCLQAISESLGPQTKSEHAIQESGQWPRLTTKALLSCIASTSRTNVPHYWIDRLISVAKFGLEYQRARRMLLLATNGHFEDLCKEMENTGCDGWNANSYPDWLLIQLEGNFLIRRIQANVAFEMIAPQSGENTALQLHMGEGKSSVIVPMAALALADGDQLVRVVVPKALITQMYQLLVDRLGGLTNRRIYHIPFSRSLQMDQSRVKMLQIILDECRRERGILVAQPDHILSFKLMSVEKQLRQDNDVADELLKTQRWLHLHVRDILDESDEILHVRNQMVYTIGSQQLLQGFPERWSTTQQMLNLVKKHASSLQEAFPHGVEHETRHPGAFPHFRILQADAGQDLITTLARDVMDGLLPNHSFNQASYNVRSAIFSFITKVDVGPSDVQEVQHYSGDTRIWTALLHLRGLLASGILLFALKERRWRVDFGLAPWRTMLAVPYRAKDVPAARAEFGHPDVAVTLTCLSYYYEGLTQEQLMVCFERLLQLDDPTQEYELWSPVPPCLSQLSGINIESSEQWKDYLVPNFSHNKATIDFYLSQVVFPKEAKEFRFKLSCSGWDLAEERAHVTTGFSGTNDGRYLLPMSISQRDPDHQRGTNAKVLAYLLQTENDAYMQTSLPNGERRTARELLELVVRQEPEIRAILDVGAQVLELQNNEFAAAWLELKPDALAAIYFDDNDELTVLTREGSTQLLFESSFAHRLDECVVYLDDAHTRGTDIRFPAGFRAAVTLGPKVTKDRLTQGCMRMRKLGNGHSVMFFAPLDVDRSIRDTVSKKESDDIHTTDILQWTMLETCTEIQSKAPLWVQQGTDHTSRYDAWSTFCETGSTVERLKAVWRQRDARTLEELYGPASPRELSSISIPAIRQRCLDLGILSLPDSNMAEEQEREVVHEIERERQVERPSKATPAVHLFSQGVLDFVRTGRMAPMSVPMQPIFDSIDSVAMPYHDKYAWTWRIFATPDFCRVVQGNEDATEYLRPVNWILSAESSGSDVVLVLISPFEANLLMPAIRSSDFVNLHIYTPRTHKVMRPCDDLRLYTVPPLPPGCTMPPPLIDQLNLFAGQLYLHDYSTYIRVCRFLCVNTRDLEHEGEFEVQNDGFIEPAHRPVKLMSRSTFQRSPLPFLRWLIGLRRKGMGFALTHMGKIVDGRLLREEDFETFRTGA